MNTARYIAGIDIGYSNLKVVHGRKGETPQALILPANAGPAAKMPVGITGRGLNGHNALEVLIKGEAWVTGVDPGQLPLERELHQQYTTTDTYQALYYGALASLNIDHVDVVVSGLPVSLFKDNDQVKRLKTLFSGVHPLRSDRRVTVDEVIVVPQPIGTFSALVDEGQHQAMINEGQVVVVDPGFFSVDYVAIDRGKLRMETSGTSLKAMSVVIETTNTLIAKDQGRAPGCDRIERAIQTGADEVLASGRRIPIREYVAQAAQHVALEALKSVQVSMRVVGVDADLLVITGGGAPFYQAAAQAVFKDCEQVLVPEHACLHNAVGFWRMGR